jgi:hypothetical protein
METKHTPTPWTIKKESGSYTIYGANGDSIANDEMYYPSAPLFKDAAFIVRACNAHDDLVAACERYCLPYIAAASTPTCLGGERDKGAVEAFRIVLAALNKASGKV